jgi:hypothetical protein
MSIVPTAAQRLIVELLPDAGLRATELKPLTGLESLFSVAAGGSPAAVSWLTATPTSTLRSLHPWDEAHRALSDPAAAGLERTPAPRYVEPDFVQRFPYEMPGETPESLESRRRPCQFRGLDTHWPPSALQFAWHLADACSGLRAARDRVGDPTGRRVRIAHLDTGYDPEHATLPLHLLIDLQRNFTGGDSGDATDPGRHFPLSNPGHGTATLALLAGRRAPLAHTSFDDFLGGAPHVEVVPVRIANSVIHFYTSAMARGIEYAAQAGCGVLSVSMGGLPARAWATAVNRAYEAGVALFAAAGNRIGISPPKWIVYPARFRRVVAVCGVTAAGTPYYKSGLHGQMQGCFGPPAKMTTALAAYTPNMPWAALGCRSLVAHDGAGTSAAAPQAAAAAALWLQHAAPQAAEPWQRVEAVRHALFTSADKSLADGQPFYGQGVLRAAHALEIPFQGSLPPTPADSVSFPWLRMAGVLEADLSGRELMYEVEALQLYEQYLSLQELVGDADPAAMDLPRQEKKRLFTAMAESAGPSQALRAHLVDLAKQL